MSYVSGTGLISGSSGGSSSQNIEINIDHEGIIKNKNDIASLQKKKTKNDIGFEEVGDV